MCALGSWENRVTVATPGDTGAFTAEIVLGDESERLFANRVIFVGVDTVSYEELVRLVESVTGQPTKRAILTVAEALSACLRAIRGMHCSSIELFLVKDAELRGIFRGLGTGSEDCGRRQQRSGRETIFCDCRR